MKPRTIAGLLTFALLGLSDAQEVRFFRIGGPVAVTITAFSTAGHVTWTNAATNATFALQTAQSLTGPSNWVDYLQVPVTNPVTMLRIIDPNPPSGLVLIPAGSFTMGDTFSEGYSGELPTHTVYVSALYMDRYEVTKALWDDVCQWATHRPPDVRYIFEHGAQGKAISHPAQSMTWYDALKWCNARSEKEGRTPAYYISAAQTDVYRAGQVNVNNAWVKWNSGYRLPTEAEWEKAARGGVSAHRFPWSASENITHARANYYSSTSYSYDISPTRGCHPNFTGGGAPYTSPVGSFAPNGYGLYDLAGNVYEWCWDWYSGTSYTTSPMTDPRGPGSGSYRVGRGGSWNDGAIRCRAAYRSGGLPEDRYDGVGFRSVLPSAQ